MNTSYTLKEIVNKYGFDLQDINLMLKEGLVNRNVDEEKDLRFNLEEIERIRLASEMSKAGLSNETIVSIMKNSLIPYKEKDSDSDSQSDFNILDNRIYKKFFNSANIIIMISDEQGFLLGFNKFFRDKLGYGEEIIGSPLIDLHPEDLRLQARDNFSQMLRGSLDFCPLEILSKSGELIPVISSISIEEVNQKKYIFGISRVVDTENQVFNLIQNQKNSFRIMFDLNMSGMIVTSIESDKIISVNKSFERITGYSADEILGKSFFDMNLAVDHAQINYFKEQIVSHRVVENLEISIIDKYGKRKVVLFSSAHINFEDPTLLITVSDITHLKNKQEELELEINEEKIKTAKSLSLTQAMMEAIPDSVILFDKEGNILDVNDNNKTGYSVFTQKNIKQNISDIVTESVSLIINQAIQETLTSGLSNNNYLKIETDSSERWYSMSLRLISEDEENIIAICQDISSIVKYSQDLKSSEARYRAIFDSTASAMLLIDLYDGALLDMNNKVCELFGYNKEELEKMNFQDFSGDFKTMLKGFQGSEIYAKDGDHFWTTIQTKKGNVKSVDVYLDRIEVNSVNKLIANIHDISLQVKAANDLNKSRLRLQSLIEGSDAGLWDWNVQTGEVILDGNYFNMLGYQKSDFETFSIDTWRYLCHPDDLKKSDDLLSKYFAGEIPSYECEVRMKHKDGHWAWIIDKGRILERDELAKPLRVIGTHLDYSEKKQALISLQRRLDIENVLNTIYADFAKNDLAKTSETIDIALKRMGEFAGTDRCYLFLLDNQDETMSNSHEWCADGVEPQKELLTDLPQAIFPWWMKTLRSFESIYIPVVNDMRPEAKAEKEILQEQDVKSILVLPVHTDQELFGFIGFDAVSHYVEWLEEDITILNHVGKLIASNVKMQKVMSELINAKDVAQESNRVKSEFISNINHEVRTPLNAITSFLELLDTTELPLQAKKFVPKIMESAYNLADMLKSMITINKLDYGEITFNYGDCDLKQILKDVLLDHDSVIVTKKLDVKINYTNDEFPLIKSDDQMLKYILDALISNAVKFTNAGGVSITLEVTREENPLLKMTITDTGVGMNRKQLNNIFESFYQTDSFISKKCHGFGLGLSLVKKIIKLMGGEIKVTSELGEGTEFYIQLPTAIQVEKESIDLADKQKKIKILLVEDTELIAKMMSTLLERKNFGVVVAENGQIALDLTEQEKFDLILMDIHMPVMDGLTASKLIKQSLHNSNNKTPIIAVSAHLEEHAKETNEWIDDVVSKPVHFPTLFEKIKEFMDCAN